MQKKSFITLWLALLLAGVSVFAQQSAVVVAYIEKYRDAAIAEMLRSGVPASITLAQGIHETSAGTSPLVLKSNNHFGIKCKSNWTGESVSHTDDAPNECFRKYNNPEESYKDHSDFLKNSSRYASLFNLDPADYRGWAFGLKQAGYATNPRYPTILIKLVEDYNLQDYTLMALGKKERNVELIVKNELPVADAAPASLPVKDYPSGLFKINDTKVLFAIAGTPLLVIATENKVPLARLFEFNEMKECEVLVQGQLIYLQRKRKTGNDEFHTVMPGQTVYDIAREQAIRLESLLEYNHINVKMQPAPGEKLYLRAKAPSPPRLAAAGSPAKGISGTESSKR